MPAKKISQLPQTNPQPGDEIPVNRGGVNYKVVIGGIASLIPTGTILNLDGGMPDTEYAGIESIDAGGV